MIALKVPVFPVWYDMCSKEKKYIDINIYIYI